MPRCRLLIVAAILLSASPSASGGIFSRKPKPAPDRVPELLAQLKSGADETQRVDAAEELRQYDPKAHPEIVSSLIEALGKDSSAGVRAEAAASLGKLRPISQQVGYALEQAQSNDGAMRVRLAARQALLQYHLVGYRSNGKGSTHDPGGAQAVSASSPGTSATVKSPQTPTRILMTPYGPFRETAEPPLADPPPIVQRPAPAAIPVAQPKGAAPSRLIPSPDPKLKPIPGASWTPAPKPAANEGPALPPPSP